MWNRYEGVRKMRQRLAPLAFKRSIRYRVEGILHFCYGAQIVDVPVQRAIATQMPPEARPQPACSARAANIEIMPGGQVRSNTYAYANTCR